MPINPPGFDPLPDAETSSLYQAANTVGRPPVLTIEPSFPLMVTVTSALAFLW